MRLRNFLKGEAREAISINSFQKYICRNSKPNVLLCFLGNVLLILFIQNWCTSEYFIIIFINVISQILHFVHADTIKTCTISFLYSNIIIKPETISLINYLRLTFKIVFNIDTNLLFFVMNGLFYKTEVEKRHIHTSVNNFHLSDI